MVTAANRWRSAISARFGRSRSAASGSVRVETLVLELDSGDYDVAVAAVKRNLAEVFGPKPSKNRRWAHGRS